MMKTRNVNNAIENYLGGQSDKTEKKWLSEEMKRDPLLTREINLRRKTDEILADREILELRNKLSVIEMKKRTSATIHKTVLKTARYAAAITIVAVISTAAYFILKPEPSPDKLYAANYERYESHGASRSVASSGNTLMDNAIALYSAKEYDKAIGYLEQVINNEKENMESIFMHGMANMEVHNYPVASGSFTRVMEDNNNLYLEDAAWYLGLCYMMTDNNDKAAHQFEAIAATKSRYSKQAARLAKKLR